MVCLLLPPLPRFEPTTQTIYPPVMGTCVPGLRMSIDPAVQWRFQSIQRVRRYHESNSFSLIYRVRFYSPDKKWHLRNATSDLFQWSLTGVAQMLLFNRAAIYLFYSLNLGGGVGVGGRIWLWPPIHFQGLPGCLIGLLYPFPYLRCCSA